MRNLLLATAVLTIAAAAPARAESGDGMTGALGRVIDKVVSVFTGGDDADKGEGAANHGQENAAARIEHNLEEKHGGEHKGLENALANKQGKAGSAAADSDDLLEEIAEDIAEGAKDEIENELGADSPAPGKGHGNGKGNGKDPHKD